MTTLLDWSGYDGAPLAFVGELASCQFCARPALLRHPGNRKPCHKVCAEHAWDAAARLGGTRR